jgi:hypothetical protein
MVCLMVRFVITLNETDIKPRMVNIGHHQMYIL